MVGSVIELTGVGALVGGVIATVFHSAFKLIATRQSDAAYQTLRRDLGKSILAGLEFLVAADIIRSIAITLTFQSVGVLGLIVLVRTFLSWSLEVEVTGTWPWRRWRSQRCREGTDEA
jgi:uncharacterized membrane protein